MIVNKIGVVCACIAVGGASHVSPRRCFDGVERSDLGTLPFCDFPLGTVGSGRMMGIWIGGGSRGIPSICACTCRKLSCSPCCYTVCRSDVKGLMAGLLLAFLAFLVGM